MSCLALIEHLTCTSCALHETRNRVVPGHGNPKARIAFIGEGPGSEEDKVGEPFVGPAGRRLNLLLGRVGLRREEVWYDNTISCRPPGNDIRAHPNSVIVCPSLWLLPKLEQVGVRVIVAMGRTAGALYFPGKMAHELATLARFLPDGRVVVGSYHPSYALREGPWVEESIVGSFRRAKELAGG